MTDLLVGGALPAGLSGPSTEPRAARGTRSSWTGGVVGIAVVLVIWELLAVFVFEGKHIRRCRGICGATSWPLVWR